MNPILRTQIKSTKLTKYYEGIVKEINYSKMGHLHFSCVNCKSVIFRGNIIVKSQSARPIMGFMIPKRRYKLFTRCQESVSIGNKYIFQLTEESKSKKLLVSEVWSV